MDRRAWRVTGLQLAIVGLEAVWVALMALVLSPGRAVGGAVLLGTGIVTLLWNRWLLRRSWWERGWGRAAGLLGMLLLLVAAGWAVEPGLMARAAAEPEYRLRVAILLGSKSLLVAWLAAVTVMARIVLLLRRQLTFERAIGRIRTAVTIGMVALALLHGDGASLTWLVAGMVAFALIVLPFARAIELARERSPGGMPFTARWTGTLLLGVLVVLVLGLAADGPLEPGHFAAIQALVGLVQSLLVHLFAIVLELLVHGLLPVVIWLMDLYSEILRSVVLPWLELLLYGRSERGSGQQVDIRLLQTAAVILVVVTIMLPIMAIWHLYRLFRYGALSAEGALETEEAVLAAAWYEWWKARRDAWSQWLSRFRRRRFGVDTVLDLYRNLLLFGDEHELPRPTANTPYEYLEPLCERYPALIGEFHALTDAYVSARYGEHEFSERDVRRLQDAWGRISAFKEERAPYRAESVAEPVTPLNIST